ncbi:hypothetical protein [Citreimonas salinaria]|uniref:hypothetical protein n=1 Tax=Citreimonas salinaria TaxID=321339 RepID=UPI0011600A55|nr:hypothetical protein [Citreimonas salinaria]
MPRTRPVAFRIFAFAALGPALGAGPVAAQEPLSLRERIDALRAPEIVIEEPYADEIADDLAMIAAEGDALFGGEADIALFVGSDCAECAAAQAELAALAERIGVDVAVHHTDQADSAALMKRLTLDMVPSYVMPDRLIRGAMPAFVLERYLTR